MRVEFQWWRDLESLPAGGTLKILAYAEADESPDATPLQKLQIIKGWVSASGEAHYKVFDVAGDTKSNARVDVLTGKRSASGHRSLSAVFEEFQFDPAVDGYYYLRVLEDPGPRWTWIECLRIPRDQRRSGFQPR